MHINEQKFRAVRRHVLVSVAELRHGGRATEPLLRAFCRSVWARLSAGERELLPAGPLPALPLLDWFSVYPDGPMDRAAAPAEPAAGDGPPGLSRKRLNDRAKDIYMKHQRRFFKAAWEEQKHDPRNLNKGMDNFSVPLNEK